MDKEWQEIKKCFANMAAAPDIAPRVALLLILFAFVQLSS